MLPIALNRAVKVIPILLHEDKEYICIMRLHGQVPEEKLLNVLKEFTGSIYQRPPLRSAVKRVVRIRRVYGIELLEKKDKDVLLKIHCEAGTYIRKLCHDIGEVLGIGAHMQELRRIRSGCFSENDYLATLQDVVDAYHFWKENGIEKFLRKVILPVEYAVRNIPRIIIRNSAVDAIAHGAYLMVPGILQLETGIKRGDTVAIFTKRGELVAIGEARMRSEEILIAEKGVAVATRQVIMKPGVYPRMWKRKVKENE